MKLRSDSFAHGQPIPGTLAFGVPGEPVAWGGNRNPHLAWSGAPEGTRSFAVICHDPDVPSVGDDVNQVGKWVPYDLPRVDFFHWVLVDLPAGTNEIAEGADSQGVTEGGKPPGPSASGGVQGINDYTGWFSGDAALGGDYGGWDGPGPPWNDTRIHRYVLTVYALDVASLGLSGAFTGGQALEAMQGHVLGQAEYMGTYTIAADAR
jgi:Raf kinase inhibitor-like YbhB/YbcL family protein